MARVQVRPLKTREEFRECERIQKAVWGTLGVSAEMMSVTQKYGGAVIGALMGDRVVGFIYAFLARRHGRLLHWSHMMAVEPGHRDRGLGFRMKRVHRKFALELGLKSIAWTYDPLQSRNAALNLRRLGGRVEEYLRDCYGNFPSRIEKGLPSDRVVVNWQISASHVGRRLALGPPEIEWPSLPQANETRLNTQHFSENRRLALNLREPRFLVEIPSNADQMRARAFPLARRWRFELRRIFERYLSSGYQVEDFLLPGAETGGRCFYILRRRVHRN